MFDFHEKRKIRSFLYSKIFVFGLFLLAFVTSFAVYNRYTVAETMKEKLEDKRVELEELRTRAQALESKVRYLEDKRGVEEELRNRFDVAKEGEKVIILIDPKEDPTKKGEDSSDTTFSPKPEPTEETFGSRLKFWQ